MNFILIPYSHMNSLPKKLQPICIIHVLCLFLWKKGKLEIWSMYEYGANTKKERTRIDFWFLSTIYFVLYENIPEERGLNVTCTLIVRIYFFQIRLECGFYMPHIGRLLNYIGIFSTENLSLNLLLFIFF